MLSADRSVFLPYLPYEKTNRPQSERFSVFVKNYTAQSMRFIVFDTGCSYAVLHLLDKYFIGFVII